MGDERGSQTGFSHTQLYLDFFFFSRCRPVDNHLHFITSSAGFYLLYRNSSPPRFELLALGRNKMADQVVAYSGESSENKTHRDEDPTLETDGSILANYINGYYKLSMWIPSDLGKSSCFFIVGDFDGHFLL